MKIIDKKPAETPENIFYGVNVNDKVAVEKEFLRLKKVHRNVTILVIIVLCILGVIIFDFCRVNFFDAKPIFAIEEKVERGTMFSGIGYKVLYCSNGERHIGTVLYKTCAEPEESKFSNLLYSKLVDYAVKEKIMDEKNVEELKIVSVTLDDNNDQGGSDYLVNISYSCKNGSVTCFKTEKEFFDINDVNLFVRINKYNEIYDLEYFKTSGAYYDILVEQYTEKIKTYLIENQMLVEENLRLLSIRITENHGKYNFRGTVYADSYLVEINYLCLDDTNTCVQAIDKKDMEGDYANLTFYASMFVDKDENVLLIGPREYLEL